MSEEITPIKRYACQQCGRPFEAIAPDDIHTLALSDPCHICEVGKRQSYKLINYECKDCHFKSPLYWYLERHHPVEEDVIRELFGTFGTKRRGDGTKTLQRSEP